MVCRLLCVVLFLAFTAELPNDTLIYFGYWRSPFGLLAPLWTSIPGINLWPWQLMFVALLPLGLLQPGAFRRRAWTMDAAILVSMLSIAITLLWGVMRGGSAYQAYYQLWRFLAALVLGFVVPCVVRNPRDLKRLGVTILAAAVVRGILGTYFYWAYVHGKIDPPPPQTTTHDDSVLFVTGVFIMLTWALARRKWSVWAGAFLVFAIIFYAMVLNNRRLAWIELVFGGVFLYLLLPPGVWRRRVNRWVPLLAPLVLAYVAAGWGRQGAVFAPVRALSTAGSDADASSLARQEEIRNLLYTMSVAGNPVLGTGWGVPYQKVTSIYANFGDKNWWQYLYLPHNSLLATAVFGGFVCLFGMWVIVPVAAYHATRGQRAAPGDVERCAAMVAVCVLPAYGAQCYGDVGVQSLTCGLIMGVALGVAAKVSAWADSPTRASRRVGAHLVGAHG